MTGCKFITDSKPSNSITLLQLILDVYRLKTIHPFDLAANKGRGDLSTDEVSRAYLFEGASDADISIVLGPSIKGHCHLVLCRFHKPKTLPQNQAEIDQLFHDVMAVAGKKGFECQRKGGSNGYTRYDRTLMSFLATPGVFPRPAKNVVVLQGKTKWECLYMSANNKEDKAAVDKWNSENPDRRLRTTRANKWNLKHPDCPIDKHHPFFPVKWVYTPPVVGGSFSFPPDLVIKYPFVFEFTELKLKTALILEYLNKTCMKDQIAPGCIHTEIDHFVTAMYKYKTRDIPTQTDPVYAAWTKNARPLCNHVLQ